MGMSPYLKGLRAKLGSGLILMAGTAAVIRNDAGHVLLHRRGDNGMWGLPGGAIDPGESPAEACAREVREETGLIVTPTRILGVIGGTDMRLVYPNGDVVEVTCMAFECHVTGGALFSDGHETLELKYWNPEALPPMFPAITRGLVNGQMREGWFKPA